MWSSCSIELLTLFSVKLCFKLAINNREDKRHQQFLSITFAIRFISRWNAPFSHWPKDTVP